MAVSRTLSFIVGLSLPGLVAFAALGDEIPNIVSGSQGSPLLPRGPAFHHGDQIPVTNVPCTNCAEIQLHEIAARLYRIENLLREMCAENITFYFSGCGELRQQQ